MGSSNRGSGKTILYEFHYPLMYILFCCLTFFFENVRRYLTHIAWFCINASTHIYLLSVELFSVIGQIIGVTFIHLNSCGEHCGQISDLVF